MIASRGFTVLCILGVLLVGFSGKYVYVVLITSKFCLSNVMMIHTILVEKFTLCFCTVQSEAAPDCSCEWRGIGVQGCTIEVAPPPGYRCHCTNWWLWCSGDAVKCVDPKHPSCRGCKTTDCCTGNC